MGAAEAERLAAVSGARWAEASPRSRGGPRGTRVAVGRSTTSRGEKVRRALCVRAGAGVACAGTAVARALVSYSPRDCTGSKPRDACTRGAAAWPATDGGDASALDGTASARRAARTRQRHTSRLFRCAARLSAVRHLAAPGGAGRLRRSGCSSAGRHDGRRARLLDAGAHACARGRPVARVWPLRWRPARRRPPTPAPLGAASISTISGTDKSAAANPERPAPAPLRSPATLSPFPGRSALFHFTPGRRVHALPPLHARER